MRGPARVHTHTDIFLCFNSWELKDFEPAEANIELSDRNVESDTNAFISIQRRGSKADVEGS